MYDKKVVRTQQCETGKSSSSSLGFSWLVYYIVKHLEIITSSDTEKTILTNKIYLIHISDCGGGADMNILQLCSHVIANDMFDLFCGWPQCCGHTTYLVDCSDFRAAGYAAK